jgi:hypothetical protein
LFTNANTHDTEYWYNLGHKILNENDKCYFTICGTTQVLHEKYRVGSNLDEVLRNSQAFINDNKNDYMQYIRFEYNKYDAEVAKQTIFTKYSNSYVMGTDPIFERFNLTTNSNNDGVISVSEIKNSYKIRSIIAKYNKKRCIECQSLKHKIVRIDNFGIISPCVCYRMYNSTNFLNNNEFDYTDILNNKYDFCYECDTDMVNYLLRNNINSFYMCF